MGRRAVAVTPINRTLSTGFQLLGTGESLVLYVENASTTDGGYGDTSVIAPPGGLSFNVFKSTSGNLINLAIQFITAAQLVELYVDEAIDGASTWARSDTQIVFPAIPQFTRAFRFICPMLRITIANGGTGSVFMYHMLRTSTM